MALFKRTPRSASGPELAEMLAEWGRAKYEGTLDSGGLSPGAAALRDEIGHMGFHRGTDFDRRRLALVSAIRDAGLREGGWTAYGAWEAVEWLHAGFADLKRPEDVMSELVEERVRFLSTLNDPHLKMHLNTPDMVTFMRLFPDRYAQMYPHA